MSWYKISQQLKLYRGQMANISEGNYFSPDKEFARQFTQSGLDSEIRTILIDQSQIYKKEPLPKAYGFDEEDLDTAILEAKKMGYKGIWVDEGEGQPDSVFLIGKI